MSQHGMPREKAEQAGLYNVLASAVGARDMTPAVDFLPLEHGDTLLLCTDGLTKHVSDSRIAEILGNTSDAEVGCRSLIDLALSCRWLRQRHGRGRAGPRGVTSGEV